MVTTSRSWAYVAAVAFIAAVTAAATYWPKANESEPIKQSAATGEPPGAGALKRLETFGFGAQSFVDGNLYFIAYHELAHALVAEFALPVVGREEDAADRLSIMLMTPTTKHEKPEYLLAAIAGWFSTANETPLNEISWWDEHGTDQQRGFQIACLLYGTDAKRYKKVADSVALPEERRETCIDEADQNTRSWNTLIEPHYLAEGAQPTTAEIAITYEDTKDYAGDQTYLKQLGILEDIASYMRDSYKLESGITMVAKECGQPNAFWERDTRTLIMCYELVQDYRRLSQPDSGAAP